MCLQEITAKFFIQHLITEESRNPIDWNQAKLDEENNINKLHADKEIVPSYDEILNRWKGRDEWRYFNKMMSQFRDDEVSMQTKVEAAIEMDYYCRTGKWLGDESSTGDEEEGEGEDECAGESDESERK